MSLLFGRVAPIEAARLLRQFAAAEKELGVTVEKINKTCDAMRAGVTDYQWIEMLRNAALSAIAARAECASKQAEIDRLMLEFCPDEMTPKQMTEWARNQTAAKECP